MTVKREQFFHNGIYFITFTCLNWLSLFELADGYSLVYKWFDYLIDNGNKIIGYVIMPNHIHAIIGFCEHEQSINARVSNGKRFIAYGLVEKLKINSIPTLQILAEGVNASDKRRGKLHQVFEPSFDCKECREHDFLLQKLNYIHANPCRGKWNLAATPEDYIHSSAGFYASGHAAVYNRITNYSWLDTIDLSKPANS